MTRKLVSLALAIALVFSLVSVNLSANAAGPDYTPYADTLKDLGLFLGTGNGYELNRNATRVEAAVMVVRLLGKDGQAKVENNKHPFTDVPAWASYYIGYLYRNNLVKGTSATRFNAAAQASPAEFGTMLLRVLGYDDGAGDFSWQKAIDKMVALGIISKSDAAVYSKPSTVSRGVMVALSRSALLAKSKNSYYTLLNRLFVKYKAFSSAKLLAAAKRDDLIAQQASVLGLPSPSKTTTAMDSESIFAKASPAVFYIELFEEGEDEPTGSGSGFFITSDGIAITNHHVIERAYTAKIHAANGKVYDVDKVLGYSQELDIALIKVKGNAFPFLRMADPGKLRVAQRIYCIGSPLGIENTISDGLVSSTIKKYTQVNDQELIQISAPISHGSSGGAMLNEFGDVVGVTTLTSIGQNLNFAVPATKASEIKLLDPPVSLQRLAKEAEWSWTTADSTEFFDVMTTVFEEEPNDQEPKQTLRNAVELPEDMDDFDYFEGFSFTQFSGTLSDAKDVDLYKINLKAASEMRIVLRTEETANAEHLQVEIVNLKTGDVLFKSRQVLDIPYRYIIEHVKKGSDYALRISSDGAEGIIWNKTPYQFYFFAENSPVGPTSPYDYGHRIMEMEPNDDFDTAQHFMFGGNMYGSLSDKDKDYYRFTLDSASDVSCIVDTYYSDEVKAELYRGDTRELITTLALSGRDLKSNTRMLQPGTYYVVVTNISSSRSQSSSLYGKPTYDLYIGNLPSDFEW